ncbi:HAD family phosphatase [Niveibacterium sp. SC-1]|uniref:HAD family hydrolase n=1 Tax=Niveibacterium sp. SC-1 TaxID=3135646 RepID=UPI003120413A
MIDTVIYDLGNVLIPWDPRRLYRKIFADEARMEHFLSEICPMNWHAQQDAGRSFAEATAERLALFPEYAEPIRAFYGRWSEMFDAPIPGSLAMLEEMKQRGLRLYALTNWSAEDFATAYERFPFLRSFEGIVVSGEEGLVKPDRRIYELLFERYGVAPTRAAFVDDSLPNVEAARALGMKGVHFRDAEQARAEFVALGVLG